MLAEDPSTVELQPNTAVAFALFSICILDLKFNYYSFKQRLL